MAQKNNASRGGIRSFRRGGGHGRFFRFSGWFDLLGLDEFQGQRRGASDQQPHLTILRADELWASVESSFRAGGNMNPKMHKSASGRGIYISLCFTGFKPSRASNRPA